MTRDDIIRMAREAKLSNEIGAFGYPYLPELERFAALIAAAEREACLNICETHNTTDMCSAAIKARGWSALL
jgi:hypothetical protein